jgi:N-succinyldiaminopimelate aminotransferase
MTRKLEPFGTSVFSEMTALANQHKAINLSQGFPDFDGPDWLKDAAAEAVRHGPNQYAPSHGLPALRQALAEKYRTFYGLDYDPDTEITVFSGCTEAIHSTFMGLLEPGDEVILLEPFYDSYPACAAMAGATVRYVPLHWPQLTFDESELAAAFNERTRFIMLNTPNNPSGKVFTVEEMQIIAELAKKHDTFVVTDEVYEHIVFDGAKHVSLATLPDMRERTVILSSTAKTFSMTGWKIGYALAPPALSKAIRSAHQFVTFCTSTPLQAAMAVAVGRTEQYAVELTREYLERRDVLVTLLQKVGFQLRPPQGTYFILADFTPFGFNDDVEFCRHLTREIGVAAIPPSAFYQHKEEGRHLVRFAFCKSVETLRQAGKRLEALQVVAQR